MIATLCASTAIGFGPLYLAAILILLAAVVGTRR